MVFYSAAAVATQGHLLDLFHPIVFDALQDELFGRSLSMQPWVHPPPTLFVVLPFAFLPYPWALAAWSMLGLCAYLMATRRTALLLAPATYMNLLVGQTGLLIGALYLGSLRLLKRRPVLAGACIGLIVVKPHLGLLIPVALLGARAWRAMGAATLSVCTVLVLSGLAFGWEAWRLWISQIVPFQAANLYEPGVTRGMPSALIGAMFIGLPVTAAWIVQLSFTAMGAAATYWAFSALRRAQIPGETALAILLLSTSIATPYIYYYDLTLISPVAWFALSNWRRREGERFGVAVADLGKFGVWALIWLLPVMVLTMNTNGLPIGSLLLLLGLVLAVASAVRDKTGKLDRGRCDF